jgi:ABC-type nitrate/sulfonate/bicarbonate transport system permease component
MSAVEKLSGSVPTEEAAPSLFARLRGKLKGEHLLYLASIVGMIALWHIIATTFFKPLFFPGPAVVLATGIEMVQPRAVRAHFDQHAAHPGGFLDR